MHLHKKKLDLVLKTKSGYFTAIFNKDLSDGCV